MKNNTARKDKGRLAEKKAEEFLRKKRFIILQKNFTIKGGEIDIIAKAKDIIVFVEVKSIKDENYIKLTETITWKKRQVLIKTAKTWLMINKSENINWRIDFIGIVLNRGKVKKFEYLENAIY